MKITDHFSPNYETRTHAIDMIVLHYTDMKNAEEARDRLCDRAAKVSAHYLIAKTGEVVRLVPEDKVAYHAGVSFWRGRTSLNQYSIGIELDNLGHQYGPEAFSEAQLESLFALMDCIRERHNIPNHNVVGHSDVAPSRKKDPGELFPWDRLGAEGHGLWSPLLEKMPFQNELNFFPSRRDYLLAQKALREIGYQIDPTDHLSLEAEQVLTAFQRHFTPLNVTGSLDAETMHAIEIVKELYEPC
jgi:N-acetylmuramoyl-L-alanine amidase